MFRARKCHDPMVLSRSKKPYLFNRVYIYIKIEKYNDKYPSTKCL